MEDLTSALWNATLKDDDDRAIQLICSGANVNKLRNTDVNPATTLLHYATMKKDVQRIRLLMKHRASGNARDFYERTPLHWAVMIDEDRPDIIEVLINGGAFVNARDYEQSTPLFMATLNDCYQSAEKLIARGASIDVVDEHGWNLLHAASINKDHKDLRMIKKLISLNINIQAENNSGDTPLHCAMEHNTDIARFLLDNGADMNKKNKWGDTPLCSAAGWNCPANTYLLLKRGARINEVNNAGNTALHEACIKKSEGVVALLVKFGADVHATNHIGKTSLQLLEPNRPSSEAIARIVIRHVVKRELLGQPICEKYREIVQSREKYSKIDQECREEIERMRSERIDVEDSAVSFFDIFSMNEEKLSALARNKNIITAFETSAYLALFRIYRVDLFRKIEKARQRANLLIGTENCLIGVLGDMLPAPILQKVAAYVEDDDTLENELCNYCD